ncbi:HNH endonuclease signature motif containing protein [Subtercola endophyticus]|uniref:HNH endonuclease signature motif containing protein n=1 Tax=Subtercola endophyticus TaxID=2895559 RepID=UPI001E2949DA|nr:HNH endonuclease signature motif containing protein [Subtercola endophyticus]UFS57549.1 HNH endonuclease [Subtercola endophyticus]
MTEPQTKRHNDRLTAELDAALVLLRQFRERLRASSLTDDELLRVVGVAAEVDRECGSIVVATAGEVGERSRPSLGGDRLSARKGCRTASELVQRITRVSSATASKLLRVGEAVRPGVSVTGQELPARFAVLGSALGGTLGGTLGGVNVCVDAANAIVTGLSVSSLRADRSAIEAAEAELVQAAVGDSAECAVPATADELRLQAAVWRSVIDPDGVEPDEERAMRHRSLSLGRATSSGVTLSGVLLPEAAARLQRLFDAYLSPVTKPVAFPLDSASVSASDSESDSASAGQPIPVDDRSRGQQQHDVFVSVLDAASRSAETPSIGGAPATVVVSVRESDVATGRGVGWVDGSDVPLSVRAVRQLVCSGGVQRVLLSDDGRIVRLGVEQRCFDGRQRRAITLRDGGCVIPGCSVPASWCEIHHVDEHAAGGPTHTDNGVLVCWFHHRTIEHSGWEIRMHAGVPQIKAPPWIDRHHRRWAPATKSRTRLADAIAERIGESERTE